ncbi:hypothetical protein CMI46_01325 [Candidatus Pacearchaeota archaeon]|nr:hypothetical protein [Candidatus Pacearchaeota archaeon]|tara:strand:+ start:10110 stop:11183 length:1074 start_codon:yes stop_codon:yes gene_type:complete
MSEHLYESLLIDTIDGIQCKVYSNSHPDGKIIVKPKYIPIDKANFVDLKKRFIFSKGMFRFNLFTNKESATTNLSEFKLKFPDYYFQDEKHQNWFLVVPKDKIKEIKDPKTGLNEFMKVPETDLDPYLKAVRGIVGLILDSGIPLDKIGLNHSTLLSNYTPGKSDIDLVVYGKENGWKAVNFLSTVQNERLTWKTEDDWRKYYRDRIVSKNFNENEYAANMVQKKDDGFIDGNVFSIFVVEEPEESWYSWEDEHIPLGTVKVRGSVIEDYNSIVRPGYYEIKNSEIIEGSNVEVKRIVTWSRPFVLQAKKGDNVEAVGLLEKVKTKSGEEFHQVVLGYFDTYSDERGEKEYLKKLIN